MNVDFHVTPSEEITVLEAIEGLVYEDRTHMSVALIARRTPLKETAVRKILRHLEEADLVYKVQVNKASVPRYRYILTLAGTQKLEVGTCLLQDALT